MSRSQVPESWVNRSQVIVNSGMVSCVWVGGRKRSVWCHMLPLSEHECIEQIDSQASLSTLLLCL